MNISTAHWQAWGLAAVAGILLVAIATDIRQRRIPNQLILVALGLGVALNALGPASLEISSAGLFSLTPGALGAGAAGLGALTALALLLPMYVLRAMGAGDVKLMAGIGSFVGPVSTVNLVLFVLLCGGLLAIVRMLWAGSSRRVMGNVAGTLGGVWFGAGGRFDPATQSADRMPYAVAIAAGVLSYGVWIFSGHQPVLDF